MNVTTVRTLRYTGPSTSVERVRRFLQDVPDHARVRVSRDAPPSYTPGDLGSVTISASWDEEEDGK